MEITKEELDEEEMRIEEFENQEEFDEEQERPHFE